MSVVLKASVEPLPNSMSPRIEPEPVSCCPLSSAKLPVRPETSKVAPDATSITLEASEPLPVRASVPAATVVVPVYVFAPVSVSVCVSVPLIPVEPTYTSPSPEIILLTAWASLREKVSRLPELIVTAAVPSVPLVPALRLMLSPGTPPTRTNVSTVTSPESVLVPVRIKPRVSLVIPPAGSAKVTFPAPEMSPCSFSQRPPPVELFRIWLAVPTSSMLLVQVQLPSICESLPEVVASPRTIWAVPMAVRPLRIVWNSESSVIISRPEKLFQELASSKPVVLPV